MSFNLEISEKDLASSIFLGRNHRKLLAAAIRAKKERGITQLQIAKKIGVHKSVISRALAGKGNLTERTIGEICWALGYEPELVLTEIREGNGGDTKSVNELPTFNFDNSRVSSVQTVAKGNWVEFSGDSSRVFSLEPEGEEA